MARERRRLELERHREEKERKAEYAKVLKLMQKHGARVPQKATPAPGRRRSFGADTEVITDPLRVFAEGDSWFDYPYPLFGGGIIPRLEDFIGLPILNMAKAGDEVRFMLGVEERKALRKRLADGAPSGGPWDALLFSGGGNDIVDDPMALWILDYASNTPPASLIHPTRFNTALAMVRAGYEDLISMRDQHSPGTWLFFHGYDFAIPDGRGVCGMGPWLKPTFTERGFTNMNVAQAVVKVMLQRFVTMLTALAAQHPRVVVIATQGTLTGGSSDWHNELHPSKGGFKRMAAIFRTELERAFPGRI